MEPALVKKRLYTGLLMFAMALLALVGAFLGGFDAYSWALVAVAAVLVATGVASLWALKKR